ncbi:MAG: CoA-acylating methylmalonate-semialdehyde dehydrogenase [Deltaproteobacteria bacterium]|jgi:malonate-semialdehyde dehydrogenase (acetylating) / methylmalonate-semialdehyde dehydrogenase|nr:CoA-acylating methylmalonate-semialdehyde dehydrogenase [Deltaproteobacteria bacterium]MBT6492179.1 CoA-acylating methylmalonate-semialdehyde dehydrogenase [Deltaproteobacteria bacterium]
MNGDVLKNFVNGQWEEPRGVDTLPLVNPATGERLAQVPLTNRDQLNQAVKAAKDAFEDWRDVPAIERARYLFRYKALLDEHKEELARTLTKEHGKTLAEARGSIRRGIENVEHACGIPALMQGTSLSDISPGIDCKTIRQPLGVYAAITPFNFPAMVPLWFWPYAVATGNTFILKPSEKVPLSQQFQFELIEQAGFPKGVLSMVHGTKEVAEGLVEHPDVQGISFVGSTAIARKVYERASSLGKRVQALGGAKNHVVIMPDAVEEPTVNAVVDSAFGCGGQRCLAASVAVLVGDAYDKFKDKLVERASEFKLGNGLDEGVTLGPVICAGSRDRILSYIEKGVQDGAKILLDGRKAAVEGYPDGEWVGPTIFDEVTDDMAIYKEEIFGPVLALRKAKNLDEALSMVQSSEYANATAIFTSDGGAARKYQTESGVSMVGVNVGVAAPMAFFPFGGTKSSFFGDVKAHGDDSIRFFTDAKVVMSRWF